MFRKTIVIPNNALGWNEAALGRLVVNLAYPEQTYLASEKFLDPQAVITVNSDLDFSEIRSRLQAGNLGACLEKCLAGFIEEQKSQASGAIAPFSTTYKLHNSDDNFENICTQEKTRLFFERWIRRGRHIYMIVEIKTLTDAALYEAEYQGATISATGGTDITGGTFVPAVAGVPVVAAQAGLATERLRQTAFVAKGERIYALLYRQVEFSWFAKKSVNNAFLEKGNRWELYSSQKGASKSKEEAKTVVEAKLGDVTEVELGESMLNAGSLDDTSIWVPSDSGVVAGL
jgi:hypothetical protein